MYFSLSSDQEFKLKQNTIVKIVVNITDIHRHQRADGRE